MSSLNFKKFTFDPKKPVVLDDDSDSQLADGNEEETALSSKSEESEEEQEEQLGTRRARKLVSRSRYVELDSNSSGSEGDDHNPEDPSFGAKKRVGNGRAFTLKPTKEKKAEIVTIPNLRKNLDEFRPLKRVDKGLFEENNLSQSKDFKPLRRKNAVVLSESSNDSLSAPRSSQLDDIQKLVFEENSNQSQSSNSQSSVKFLNVPKTESGSSTPKRKKHNNSSDEEETMIGSTRKKQRRRVVMLDDDSSNDVPTANGSGSSKENAFSASKSTKAENIDDIQLMLEDELSDINDESDYSEEDIIFDSEGEESGDDRPSKSKSKSAKDENNAVNLKSMIVDLVNNGSEADLLNIPTMTKKKMEAVVAARPFENWSDIMDKFNNTNVLSIDLLENVKNNAKSRSMISSLLSNCKRISDQIKNTVQNLKGLTQPKILSRKLVLKPYQLIGLNWMAMMHEKGINGILADEMGLGKTVQVISLLAHLRMNKQIRGPHMIVVPSSILHNWSREFETWCPAIQVLEYHGSQTERAEMRQRIYSKELKYDVLLTTYNLCYSNDDRKLFTRTQFRYIIFDEAHMLKNMKTARFNNLISLKSKNRLMLTGTPIQNNLLELMTLLLFTMPNMFGSKRQHIEAFFRDKKIETDTTGFVKSKIEQAKEILKPFILRRLKENVLKDLPSKIQKYEQIEMTENQKSLYDKFIEDCKKQFTEMREERAKASKSEPNLNLVDGKRKRNIITYDEEKLLDAAHLETEEAVSEVIVCENSNDSVVSESSNDSIEIVKVNMKKSTAMLMELRKCANHPLLLRHNYTDDMLMEMARTLKLKEDYYRADGNVQYIFEDMQHCNDFDLHMLCQKFASINKYKLSEDKILDSGKFKYLDNFLPKLTKEGHRVLIFSQFQMMLDILEQYLKIRNHRFVRLDGATKVTERMGIIDNFYEDKDIRVFLITTKAGGLGINLVEANHVIIHDIDFNPYNDKQAEDRAHRMGQTKDVYVFKLVSSDSIEVHMMNTCIRKLEVGRTITSDQIEQDKIVEAKDIKAMLKNALKM